MNSISWKRNNNLKVSRPNRDKKEEKIEFLTFGYSCKLFNDENQARYLDQGKNLIPWMGDECLLIDRFDVRGYLYPNDLKKYESSCDKDYESYFTKEEYDFENELNHERYKDLFLLQEEEHEKELKRLNECLEEDIKKVNQIEFNYDNIVENKQNSNQEEIKQKIEKKDYIIPKGLNLPNDIQTPSTMKVHNLIEKTAKFISNHGIQMEILLKIKQASNSKFDFLNYDSPLNTYYKYLIDALKQGNYKVNNLSEDYEGNDNLNENSDKESDTDDYLHPSLSGSKELNANNLNTVFPKFIPAINEQSLYSKLAKNLKEKIIVNEVYNESKIIEAKEVKYKQNSSININKKEETKVTLASLLPEIPTEIDIIIKKLAQYVARNGDEFEETVKNRNEERFNFLNPGHKFYFHYVKTKLKYLEEKKQNENKLKEKNKEINTIEKLNLQYKCSNQVKISQPLQEPQLSAHEIEKLDKERLLKEKQMERRRKAAIFLTSLKKRQDTKELSNSNQNEEIKKEPIVFGPELPPSKEDLLKRIRNTPSPLVQRFDNIDAQNNSNMLSFSLVNSEKNNLEINKNDDNDLTIFKKISKSYKKSTRRRSLSVDSEDRHKNNSRTRSKEKTYKESKYHKSSQYKRSYYSRSRSNSSKRYRHSRSSSKSSSSRSLRSKSSKSSRRHRSHHKSSKLDETYKHSKSRESYKHKKSKKSRS